MIASKDDFTIDFIGIGVYKSGTTWLGECLREHKQICFPRLKELSYFSDKTLLPDFYYTNQYKGERWLRQQFQEYRTGQIRGEYSNCYLTDPVTPKILKERFPNLKLIVSYRNPTDVIYSLYYHLAREFTVPDSFEQFLQNYPSAVGIGRYYTQTQRFLNLFQRDNIHFILYEDIVKDSKNVIEDVFKFLGVQHDYVPANQNQRINERKTPKSLFIRNAISLGRSVMNYNAVTKRIRNVLSSTGLETVATFLNNMNLKNANVPPMKTETKKFLLGELSEEIRNLSVLLDRDLSHWFKI